MCAERARDEKLIHVWHSGFPRLFTVLCFLFRWNVCLYYIFLWNVYLYYIFCNHRWDSLFRNLHRETWWMDALAILTYVYTTINTFIFVAMGDIISDKHVHKSIYTDTMQIKTNLSPRNRRLYYTTGSQWRIFLIVDLWTFHSWSEISTRFADKM